MSKITNKINNLISSYMFDHEKLRVYQLALDFSEWIGFLLEKITPKISVCNHLDEASSSIPLNIAEGNGKFTAKDRCRYFDTARGSALECARRNS
ncbi:MAG: four helix bundle protein [Ignavibacteria bacterium]|nr:four helix bundle protein [Ignavibacteria bacterium]